MPILQRFETVLGETLNRPSPIFGWLGSAQPVLGLKPCPTHTGENKIPRNELGGVLSKLISKVIRDNGVAGTRRETAKNAMINKIQS